MYEVNISNEKYEETIRSIIRNVNDNGFEISYEEAKKTPHFFIQNEIEIDCNIISRIINVAIGGN